MDGRKGWKTTSIRVPRKLWKDFSIVCLQKEVYMQDVITALIEGWLRNPVFEGKIFIKIEKR